MGNSQTLATELRQQQRLTPLQVQFVRMLEMTAPEVEDEVRKALDEMPALEVVESENDTSGERTEDGDQFTESDSDLQRADYGSDDDVPQYLVSGDDRKTDPGFNDSFRPMPRGSFNYDPDRYFEPVVADNSLSLVDFLENQIGDVTLSDLERKIALYIIGALDDNGYLNRSAQAIADDVAIHEGVDVRPSQVLRIIDVIRQLDPPGVGAYDLRDCLLLQLRRMVRSDRQQIAIEMLENYFDFFSKKHFDKIMSEMDINADQLKESLALIRKLDPKPGSSFTQSDIEDMSRHIVPDFSVEVTSDGNIHLSNLTSIPELRVEASFDDDGLIGGGVGPRFEAARAFVSQKRDDARNFIKVLKMREETLFNVMSAIVRLQRDFFLTEDDENIRPMVLRDIADITGDDLSVISRATNGKYVATPHAVYPLKKFFNAKPIADNENLTSNRIIARIREAIAAEDPRHPLSDRRIGEILADAGYDIARRTVAKYRENLGYPVARLRKKL